LFVSKAAYMSSTQQAECREEKDNYDSIADAYLNHTEHVEGLFTPTV